ncbi:hypothetical protein AB0I28_38020 [Phytomonospora sp. NPDC050363]|uniref:hypothetical protein n=1 Tax=Phytomonospora sp. NPDC050363 TaxID=3155642 RepID=UPI0033E6189F
MLVSRRLVLRHGDEADVGKHAAALGYTKRMDVAADEDAEIARTVIWHADTGPGLVYREDLATGLPFLVVTSADPVELRGAVELAETVLDTWRLAELLAGVDAGQRPRDLAEAILLLGLGAPSSHDPRFYSRVSRHLASADATVAEAALFAVRYQPWEEYVDLIAELAAGSGPAAASARELLEQLEDDGVDDDLRQAGE